MVSRMFPLQRPFIQGTLSLKEQSLGWGALVDIVGLPTSPWIPFNISVKPSPDLGVLVLLMSISATVFRHLPFGFWSHFGHIHRELEVPGSLWPPPPGTPGRWLIAARVWNHSLLARSWDTLWDHLNSRFLSGIRGWDFAGNFTLLGFFSFPIMLSLSLPVSPGSTSLVNKLHRNLHFRVCFQRTWPKTGVITILVAQVSVIRIRFCLFVCYTEEGTKWTGHLFQF